MLPVFIIKRKIVSKNQNIFKCVLSASYKSFVTFSIILKSNKPSLDLTYLVNCINYYSSLTEV